MNRALSPCLQKQWEKDFYKDYHVNLNYLDFSCKNPVIIYDILEDSLSSSCLKFSLTLRFEVRVKEKDNPIRYFSMLYVFFHCQYGILTSSIKSGSSVLDKENCLIRKKYEFTLSKPFTIDFQEYIK